MSDVTRLPPIVGTLSHSSYSQIVLFTYSLYLADISRVDTIKYHTWPKDTIYMGKRKHHTQESQKVSAFPAGKLLESLNLLNGTNLTLSFGVDQDTYRNVIKHKKTQYKREPRGQSFPSRWPQGYKEQTRQNNKDKGKIDNRIRYELALLCPQLWKSWRGILLSPCPCVRPSVRASVTKFIKIQFWNFIFGFLIKK